MTSTQAGWAIYNQQMGLLHHGDALWEPAPIYSYKRIKLGDVGYIRRGRFHLLFSAGCPLGSRRLGTDVPPTFEPLDIGLPIYSQPRLPGYLCTSTVKETGAGLSASVSATPFLEPGASFSFELTEKQGAALITKYLTYREDIEPEAIFDEYTKRHYNSWVAFARKRHGNDIKPVLVSGVDMTRNFAMIAYSNNSTQLSSKFTVSVPLLASASASVWGTWHRQGLVHTNCGPQLCTPPPPSDALELHPPDTIQVNVTPNEFDQCVFVRYYTMRRKALMFPKIMRAAAGPHDPDAGDDYDEIPPELMARLSLDSDAGSNSSGDSTMDYLNSVTGHDSDLELYHHASSEESDVFDDIAEYVFRNSEAEAVLIHHRDIAQLREGMIKAKMSEIISERRPYINVDSAGVGNLVHRNQEEPTSEHEKWSTPQTRESTSQEKSEPTRAQVSVRSSPVHAIDLELAEAVYSRLLKNITKWTTEPQVKLPSGTCIPQRPYCQGTAIPDGVAPKVVMFAMVDGKCFPATLALAGHCDNLVDSSGVVFTELNHTINLRIEWPGYDGWGAQIRAVNYQEEPKGVTRAKLVKEIARQVERFIEKMKTAPIDPTYAQYRVGPEGIELRHIHIASLEQVSRGSWQPRFIYSGQ